MQEYNYKNKTVFLTPPNHFLSASNRHHILDWTTIIKTQKNWITQQIASRWVYDWFLSSRSCVIKNVEQDFLEMILSLPSLVTGATEEVDRGGGGADDTARSSSYRSYWKHRLHQLMTWLYNYSRITQAHRDGRSWFLSLRISERTNWAKNETGSFRIWNAIREPSDNWRPRKVAPLETTIRWKGKTKKTKTETWRTLHHNLSDALRNCWSARITVLVSLFFLSIEW